MGFNSAFKGLIALKNHISQINHMQ